MAADVARMSYSEARTTPTPRAQPDAGGAGPPRLTFARDGTWQEPMRVRQTVLRTGILTLSGLLVVGHKRWHCTY